MVDYKINKKLLRVKMVENSINQTDLAEKMDMTKTTLSRKLNGHSPLLLKDCQKIEEILSLSNHDMLAIFFGNNVD